MDSIKIYTAKGVMAYLKLYYMTMILDGKKLSLEVISNLAKRIGNLKNKPVLAIVLVGTNPASESFINSKQNAAIKAGVECRIIKYQESITSKDLSKKLNSIARNPKYTGIIIQLPLPENLDKSRQAFLRIVPEDKDVDCLSEKWQAKLMTGRNFIEFKGKRTYLLPPVAAAIFMLAERYNISFSGKNIVLVGWGDLVGKPLAPLLIKMGATLTVCTSKTKNIEIFTKNADIVISGTGKPNLITGDLLKIGAIVFDAGYAEFEGRVVGDVDKDSVEGTASMLSPSPGSIGPLTIACLLENVVALAELRSNKNI